MKFKYLWRIAAFFLAYGVFRILPLDTASHFGGWLARRVGPFSARHRIARDNIALALPELAPGEAERVLDGMWDNFGRIFAEYAHLGRFSRAEETGDGRISFAGLDHLEGVKRDGRGAIFIGGHIGNWEVAPLILRRAGLETVVVYRPPSTPVIDRLIRRKRAMINPDMAVKRQDVKALVSALRARRSVSMLVDQKLWQGDLVPFLGHDAHTTTMPGKLALRYGVPIVPLRVERLAGARFRVSASPPIVPPRGTGEAGAVAAERALTLAVNRVLEGWIRERPEQWHWLHRRWTIRRRRKGRNKFRRPRRPAPELRA